MIVEFYLYLFLEYNYQKNINNLIDDRPWIVIKLHLNFNKNPIHATGAQITRDIIFITEFKSRTNLWQPNQKLSETLSERDFVLCNIIL